MRRIILILLFVFIVSTGLANDLDLTYEIKTNDNLDFGIKVGAGIASFYDINDCYLILSYNCNLFLTYNFYNNFAIQPEILLIRKGSDFVDWENDYDEEYRFAYLEIPLLLKYSLLEWRVIKLNVYFGPYFALLISDKYTISDNGHPIQGTKLSDTYNVNKIDFGGAIGADFYLNKFIVDCRITLGLLPVNAELEMYKNIVMTILIGYELSGIQ